MGIINTFFQYCSDKLKAQFRYRWMATFVLACFYALRVYLHGYCLLTFFLAMILTLLTRFLFLSVIDPDAPYVPVSAPSSSILPTKASDELRPFVPFLPEFCYWCAVNKVLCVALGMTFIPSLRLPGIGIWYVYLIFWLVFAVKMALNCRESMIEDKYIPFYYGDKKEGEYKGK